MTTTTHEERARRRAPKASRESASGFIAKLFDPLPDAEIEDREMLRLERRVLSEQKSRLKHALQKGMRHVEVAYAHLTIVRAEIWLAGSVTGFHSEPWDEALLAKEQVVLAEYWKVVAKQILIPAPTRAEIMWKRSKYPFKSNPTPEMLAAVAADEARLPLKQ